MPHRVSRFVTCIVGQVFPQVGIAVADVPSGSCCSMISHHFADLFRDDPERLQDAHKLAPGVWDPVSAAGSSVPVEEKR